MADINSNILPYFRGIKEEMSWYFQIGVYGPRAVCNRLLANGLAKYSFATDMSNGFTGNIGQLMPKNWAFEQFVETTEAGIGIDKCMVLVRGTATAPAFFTTYQIPAEPDISQEFKVFENVFDLAWSYLEGFYSPTSGVYPNIFDANRLTLAYFRSELYDADHFGISSTGEIIDLLKGLAWRTIAGPRDGALLELVKSTYPDLNPHQVSVIDPITNKQLEITHYAAALGACIVSTTGLYIDFLERNIDAFAGWAGDLLHMGGGQNTLDFGGYNYFTSEDLQFIIGAPANGLQNYHLYDESGNEMLVKGGRFGQVDLLQDVDDYNIARVYNQASWAFGAAFGEFNQEFAEVVAHAFEDKIETQIEIEEYTS